MRMASSAAAAVAAALITLLSGCLSVCRLSKLDCGGYTEWSEERQECGLYPTMKMRWQLVRLSCHWAPKQQYWGQHVGVPLALFGITPGMVVDVAVDTIALPWDWKHRHNVSPDLCAGLDEERRCRSLCVLCGATSDGEFARARRDADRGTPDWSRFYGVCPDCIQKAKADGYRFGH